MRSLTHCLLTASLALGVTAISTHSASAACAISVGEGEGPNQQIAERRARRDARQKAGGARASDASFSEPACYVADNFTTGVASYGCQVEYSYCTEPGQSVTDIATPPAVPEEPRGHGGFFKKWKKHKHAHRQGRGHGRIEFGGWRRSETAVSCLNFNARASGRSEAEAEALVNQALMQSVEANVGAALQTGNVSATGAQCSITGNRKVTCLQTARFCY